MIMESVLVFEVGEDLVAVPVGVVEEIRDRASLTPVPGAPEDVLGLLQHGGRMIPVIDVVKRMGRSSSVPALSADHPGCIIVIQSDEHPMRWWCGLAVARVLGVRHPGDDAGGNAPLLDLHTFLASAGDGVAGTRRDEAPRDGAGGIPESIART
jgi:purine-binding chemotaxis protein CheW